MIDMKLSHILAGLAFIATATFAADRPNIVFLLADDMGYGDPGFNGCRDIQTPELDKLAHAGTVLDSFYVQPVCSPTRASLMTGRYVTRTGVYSIVNLTRSGGCR